MTTVICFLRRLSDPPRNRAETAAIGVLTTALSCESRARSALRIGPRRRMDGPGMSPLPVPAVSPAPARRRVAAFTGPPRRGGRHGERRDGNPPRRRIDQMSAPPPREDPRGRMQSPVPAAAVAPVRRSRRRRRAGAVAADGTGRRHGPSPPLRRNGPRTSGGIRPEENGPVEFRFACEDTPPGHPSS